MQTPPIPASVSPAPDVRVEPGIHEAGTHESGTHETRTRLVDDIVYQLMTAAAILLVLGSLWVF